jgi:ATP-dependent HslUV protease subunit HslV
MSNNSSRMHGTTASRVRSDNKVVIAGDGEVSMGEHVMEHTARAEIISFLVRDLP